MLNIELANCRIDGDLNNRWDALLRVVADFRIQVFGKDWYEEEEFCVVEFGRALAGWLDEPLESRGGFIYESMESDEPALICFSRSGIDSWTIVSPFQLYTEPSRLTGPMIQEATTAFLSKLREGLPQKDRVLELLHEEEANRRLLIFLEGD